MEFALLTVAVTVALGAVGIGGFFYAVSVWTLNALEAHDLRCEANTLRVDYARRLQEMARGDLDPEQLLAALNGDPIEVDAAEPVAPALAA